MELLGTASGAVSEARVEIHRSQPDQQASLTVLPGGGVVFTFVAGSERTPITSAPPEAPRPARSSGDKVRFARLRSGLLHHGGLPAPGIQPVVEEAAHLRIGDLGQHLPAEGAVCQQPGQTRQGASGSAKRT